MQTPQIQNDLVRLFAAQVIRPQPLARTTQPPTPAAATQASHDFLVMNPRPDLFVEANGQTGRSAPPGRPPRFCQGWDTSP